MLLPLARSASFDDHMLSGSLNTPELQAAQGNAEKKVVKKVVRKVVRKVKKPE